MRVNTTGRFTLTAIEIATPNGMPGAASGVFRFNVAHFTGLRPILASRPHVG